jgi:hypothetical protein
MIELKNKIYLSMVYLAKFYGTEKVDHERLQMYTEILASELTPDDFQKSLKLIILKCKFFPSVAEIIELAKPKEDVNAEANIIANEIIGCISRFGPYQTKEAKEFLGDKFFVAEKFGWQNLCHVTYEELGTTKAQLRELAKAYLSQKNIKGVENFYSLEENRKQIPGANLKLIKLDECIENRGH